MDERERKAIWLKMVLDNTGESASSLAKKSGFSDTTLTRFLKDPQTAKSAPKASTLNVIAETFNLAPFENDPSEKPERAIPRTIDDVPSKEKAIFLNILNNNKNLSLYQQQGRSLEMAGIHDGDYLFVDPRALPKNGDIICVSLRDETEQNAQTCFRIFYKSGHMAAALKAQRIDGKIEDMFQTLDGVNAAAYGVVQFIFRNLQ